MFNVVFFGSNGKALASKIDVSSLLIGDGLYYGSTQLSDKTFTNEFASIVSGRYMFASSNIKTFPGSLTSLQDSTMMFQRAGSLTSFTSEMPNLSNGAYMFYNTPLLASFSSSLPNLRIGEYMFQNAIALPSFSVSLPKLTNGLRMFDNCTSLETFDSVLPSLENGSYMFQGCKLSGHSVRNIVESLPTHETQHSITIGINCSEDIEGQREFLRETGYNTFEEIEDVLAAKGWKVVWHFQGFPSGWRPVEYLESTGAQYLDSGVPYANDTCIETTFEITQFNDAYSLALFGTENSNNATTARFGVLPYSNYFRWDYGSQIKNEYVSRSLNTKYKLKKDGPDNYIDDVLISSNTSSDFVSDKNGLIFARILSGSRFIGKIYSFSISRAGTLQRDLIPCVDNVGNPCFYDRISKVSFYNKGNTKFLVPTTSATYTLRQPVAEFAQLTDSGVRKLYHLPYDYEGTLEEFVEENGFKQLVENEKPEEGNWMPEWTETEDAVVLNWVEATEEIVEV